MEEIKKGAVEVGGSVAGALVGLAIGGPIGAIIGSTVTPLISMTHGIVSKARARRILRANEVVEKSFNAAGISPEDAINILHKDDRKADDYIRLLRTVMESDQEIDTLLSNLLGQLLMNKTSKEEERILILGDSIRNMRKIHITIIKEIYNNKNNMLSASQISEKVSIPEIELRNTVRDLELRGIIEDIGIEPTTWKLRELGKSLAEFLTSKSE